MEKKKKNSSKLQAVYTHPRASNTDILSGPLGASEGTTRCLDCVSRPTNLGTAKQTHGCLFWMNYIKTNEYHHEKLEMGHFNFMF